MPGASVSPDALADELAAAMPPLGSDEQRVAVALYRLLAEGRPVSVDRLAERTGRDPSDVRTLLERWPGVYRDRDAVVGFCGLALERMPHRLYVDGVELRAWCAWDTLFLPELLGRPARVASPCPETGTTVSLEVVPGDGVRRLTPATAVISFVRRDQPFDANVIVSFCHFVHFFRDAHAGEAWTARHDGTFLLPVDAGFEVGRLANHARFGAALDAEGA